MINLLQSVLTLTIISGRSLLDEHNRMQKQVEIYLSLEWRDIGVHAVRTSLIASGAQQVDFLTKKDHVPRYYGMVPFSIRSALSEQFV